jgi:nucleoside-diphosphate-sugar epimerase
MKVLVTGSAGFLGRHAVRTFEALGHTVTGVDIRSGTDCRYVYDSAEYFDIVIHLAAIVGGRATIDGNPLAVAQTTTLDVALFNYAQRVKPRHVVYPSSSAAYPIRYQQRQGHARLREQFINLRKPELPDSMYGWVKLTGEHMAARLDGPTSVHIIRPMSGYGTDQDTSYPFGAFLARAQARANPFDIWGDGTQVRDWVHVDDIMATIVRLIDQDYTQPINVGTGIATDFATLATMMGQAVGYTPTLNPLPDKPTGVHWRVADPTALHQIHTPRIELADGIRQALC